MELNVKDIVAEMGPRSEESEGEVVAAEGLKVAAEEMMEAFAASDAENLVAALRNFIKIARI